MIDAMIKDFEVEAVKAGLDIWRMGDLPHCYENQMTQIAYNFWTAAKDFYAPEIACNHASN